MIEFDPLRKKTYTSYWNHFLKKPKKFQSISLFFNNFFNLVPTPFNVETFLHK